MVCKKLVTAFVSIARRLISKLMDRKSLFWQLFPSPRNLYQMRWSEKSFFPKFAPSPEGIFLSRWLKRSSGFHRPGNFLSMDGMKSRKGVGKSSGFHPGRNYRSFDGVNSQKLLGSFPSDKAFFNWRCMGWQKVSIWSPSRQKFPQCRWKHHSNSDHSCQVANQWLPDRGR